MHVEDNSTGGGASVYGSWPSCSIAAFQRRGKTEWAGIGVGDAFKTNLDYIQRMTAQRLFYNACRTIQCAARRMTGASDAECGDRLKTKPQLGPCYTTYPSALAAYAAIGLTGFLEFKAAIGGGALESHLDRHIRRVAEDDQVEVDPKRYQMLVRIVSRAVQTRLLLHDLARDTDMALVEMYRLFAASQLDLNFQTLSEIVQAVILYGDLIPDCRNIAMHPLTRVLFLDTQKASHTFFTRMAWFDSELSVPIGLLWVRAVCRRLAKYLEPPRRQPVSGDTESPATDKREGGAGSRMSSPGGQPATASSADHIPDGRIAPLNAVHPPSLLSPPNVAERVAAALGDEGMRERSEDELTPAARKNVRELKQFAQALSQASGQDGKWEDMRSDLVEEAMRARAFAGSPIEGSPTDGHEIRIRLDGDTVGGGEVHDRPVLPSDDLPACDALAAECEPIAAALRKALYPNVTEHIETERLRTTGALDPARLSMGDYSTVIFKRYRMHEKADRKGKPLLLIACDGSGSLDRKQMSMLKMLAAAWLRSTVRLQVQVMAGLYHSGEVRKGMSGPLVQWIYHPRKTPAYGRHDALRALTALPFSGTGVQSDALSLAFMIDEAARIARGRMIYLILISDGCWNRSFQTERGGREELQALFGNVREQYRDTLHTTLVALGVDEETGLEGMIDKIIPVPEEALEDYAGMAQRIGVYVATCMKERRRYIATQT